MELVQNSDYFGTGIGFSTKAKKQKESEHTRSIISKALKNTFNPEFLNRLDEIIFFNFLNKNVILEIIDLELNNLKNRFEKNFYYVGFGIEIKEFVFKNVYD